MEKLKFNLKESEEICIIDDSPIPRTLTKMICERTLPAIPVRIFESVDAALGYLSTSFLKKRTIFLDLYMPDKSGWEFLEAYRPNPSDMVFILSSSENETDLDKAINHPTVVSFLLKPLTPEKIGELSGLAVS